MPGDPIITMYHQITAAIGFMNGTVPLARLSSAGASSACCPSLHASQWQYSLPRQQAATCLSAHSIAQTAAADSVLDHDNQTIVAPAGRPWLARSLLCTCPARYTISDISMEDIVGATATTEHRNQCRAQLHGAAGLWSQLSAACCTCEGRILHPLTSPACERLSSGLATCSSTGGPAQCATQGLSLPASRSDLHLRRLCMLCAPVADASQMQPIMTGNSAASSLTWQRMCQVSQWSQAGRALVSLHLVAAAGR